MASLVSTIRALTFDCYGTLIDWETGILHELRTILRRAGVAPPDDELLVAYARHETAWESGPYLPYREVLARTLRDICAEYALSPTAEETFRFARSVPSWPPFADSAGALAELGRRFRLGVITNCDDDLFELSRRRLGARFDWVITAERARSYKPDQRNFELALDVIGLPREQLLHVAQSLFHDHVPAKRLGLATAWVNRRHAKPGGGATPAATAQPDIIVTNLRELVATLSGPPRRRS